MSDVASAVQKLPEAGILVVHGPTGPSLTALRRLESLVADPSKITVVAGTEPGVTAAERAGDRGATFVADHGPIALATILGEMDGPVLVMHDDVEITPTAVARMLDAHRTTGITAVPGDRARRNRREVAAANLVCAVGDAGALAELAIGSAFGPGLTVAGRFVEANECPMVHTGDCQRRLVDERHVDRPVLVAAMIVRDEAEHLADCLGSLEGIVDRIEVADTGSTDETVAIARRAGANVIEIGWRDDFAWARNQILEQCVDAAYILWIDADERLVCEDRRNLRRLLATYSRLYPSYSLQIHNIDGSGVETHQFLAKRIADPSLIRFEGALHEQPRRLDGRDLLEVRLETVSIDHHGYADSIVDERDKLQRNLAIARQSFEADPTEAHAVHYARSLKAASVDPAETLLAVEPLLESVENAAAPVRSLMRALRAELLLASGQLDEAADAASDALELVPADAIAAAVLAEALLQRGTPEQALATAREFSERDSPSPLIEDHLAAQTRDHALFEAALQVGDTEAAVELSAGIPDAVDPWRPLAQVMGTEPFVDLAPLAGRRSDSRYFTALIGRTDLTSDLLARAEAGFRSAGGDITDRELIDAARAQLDVVDQAPARRDQFMASGAAADAIGYAEALALGHIDLTHETESLAEGDDAVALALGIAAEANRRRGRGSSAALDAGVALQRWPGAVRAAIVAADAALADGDAAGALGVVHSARQATGFDNTTRARRHELTTIAALAHLRLGDLASAVGESVEIVDEDGEVTYWDHLLESAGDDTQLLTLVIGLSLLNDAQHFLDAVASTLRPERTAEVCGTYLEVGGVNPNAVSTGILAAVLTGRTDLALLISGYAQLLPEEVRTRLRSHVAEAGALDVAERLGAQPVG